MIDKLEIRKFRAHKKLDIVFSPFVNCIIGRNASGKSTIIRAIRWVVRNKPSGDSIFSWNENKTVVRLTLNNLYRIIRTRSKNINSYKLDKRGWKESKKYKAFRSDVPEDIKKIINLSNINFQGQHDAPFWFCETAGEVSRQLNIIINLEIMDTTLSNISSALNKSRTTIEVVEDRLEKATIKRKSLVYIKQMNEDLKKIESIQKQKQEKEADCSLLRDIIKSALSYRLKQKSVGELRRGCQQPLFLGARYQKILVQMKYLPTLVKSGIRLQKTIEARPPSMNPLKILKKKIEVITETLKGLQKLTEEIKIHREIKCQTKTELKKHNKELTKVAEERCPLCGRKMR